MKIICFRYGAILLFILLLSFLWEFSLRDILNQHWTSRSIPGSFSEHLESVATIFIFCLVSLLYPYFHAIKEVRKRTRGKLDVGYPTPHFHEASPLVVSVAGRRPPAKTQSPYCPFLSRPVMHVTTITRFGSIKPWTYPSSRGIFISNRRLVEKRFTQTSRPVHG